MSGLCGDCGAASGCGCTLAAGTGTTVSGAGSVGSPYAVNLVAQTLSWLTNVALTSLTNRDAFLWDSSTSKFKNYKIGGIAGSASLTATPAAIVGTSFTYSSYSGLTTVTNNTALTLNYKIIVTCVMAGNNPLNRQAAFGFQIEINGAAQAEIASTSSFQTTGTGGSTTQWHGVTVVKVYNGTVAAGANVTFRVRSAGKELTSGGGCSYQAAQIDADLLAA